jgi:N-acetylglucosaminyldiphosphoundecaprenol N-acetyl-beta-D-mannosaminyltransferase
MSDTTLEKNLPPRVNILGVGVVPTTLDDAVETLETWRAQGRREYICCVSVHGVVTAQRDAAVKHALNRSGLSTSDGMPMVWWSRRAGFAQAGRVCGPDLMDALCARSASHGHSHYFYGGSEQVLERLVTRLRALHPGMRIAGAFSPPYRALSDAETAAHIAAINQSGADFVWIGLGMPKQEKWMAAHAGEIDGIVLGVGAAFDFHAGTLARAPLWMQRRGLEWAFRLASEPRRLARRYIIDNSIFVLRALQQFVGLKRYAQDW